MAVFHQGSVLHQAVLKTRPDLAAQLSIHLQTIAEVPHPDAGQVIHLNANVNVQRHISALQCNISSSCQLSPAWLWFT